MNRPSHWILAFFVIAGGALWLSGGLERLIEAGQRSRGADRRPTRHELILRNPATPTPAYAELRGQVVDRMGWPVVAAEVSVPGSDRAPVLTDTDGRFRLELAGAVQRTLRIAAAGRHDPARVHGSLDLIPVVLQDALPWTIDDLSDTPTRSLLAGEGFLKHVDGRPVARGRVVVRPTGAMAETDDDGRFVVPLPDAPCSLVAWDTEGHLGTSVGLRFARHQGKVPVPDVILEDGATLRGRIVDVDGAPIADMMLVVDNAGSRRIAESAADGAFAVGGLAHGETTVTAIPHHGLLGFRQTLDIEGDVSLGDLAVDRAPQEPLRLHVLDGADAPQSHVHVVAEQDDGLRRAYGTTDRDGEVVLAGLAADAPTVFEVRDATHAPISIAGFEPARRALIVSR